MRNVSRTVLIIAAVFLFSPSVWSQGRKSAGWRFATNRMKGVYLEEGSGKNRSYRTLATIWEKDIPLVILVGFMTTEL